MEKSAPKVLVDEDTKSKSLMRELYESGIVAESTATLGIDGSSDRHVLSAASAGGMAVLTQNCPDFWALHEESTAHAGILLIHHDTKRPLSDKAIAMAIITVSTVAPIDGHIHSLNNYVFESPKQDEPLG